MNQATHTAPEQTGLFSDAAKGHPAPGQDVADTASLRIRGSMLWAAYGDALGFVSELVDRKGLERRTQGEPLERLMAWRRRVGGRQGVDAELPPGCWSDDTQLRMAVSRSMTGHGFDVETFARIELPVWLSYALGGGRASKSAARNMGKPRALWYANTFPGWTDAGGNGAAMRIQPHVWASRDCLDDFVLDVIADSVCTHGHPRAIVGACFHAATLAHCMMFGAVPELDECHHIAARIEASILLIEAHPNLGPTWIGLWEDAARKSFRDGWHGAIRELHQAISDAEACIGSAKHTDVTYKGIIERLGLTDPRQRGSGILTTVAASALAAVARDALEAVVVAANAVGTDTDTIATMAGALRGACNDAGQPPEQPLDSDYLHREALRLAALGRGEPVDGYSYPDVLTWTAPKSQADALVSDDGGLTVEGLGPVMELGADIVRAASNDFGWQWVITAFGQTLLIKRRLNLPTLSAGNKFEPPPKPRTGAVRRSTRPGERAAGKAPARPLDRGLCVDDAIKFAREKIAEDQELGYTVRRVARDGTIADLAALVTALRDDLRR